MIDVALLTAAASIVVTVVMSFGSLYASMRSDQRLRKNELDRETARYDAKPRAH